MKLKGLASITLEAGMFYSSLPQLAASTCFGLKEGAKGCTMLCCYYPNSWSSPPPGLFILFFYHWLVVSLLDNHPFNEGLCHPGDFQLFCKSKEHCKAQQQHRPLPGHLTQNALHCWRTLLTFPIARHGKEVATEDQLQIKISNPNVSTKQSVIFVAI